MKLAPLALLALAACNAGSEDSEPLHRFKPTADDLRRLEAGELPVLILQDALPCPGALFLTEAWIPDPPIVFRTGERDRPLSPDEPGVSRADERGIVWYVPPEDYYWQRRAGAGLRVWSQPFLRWQGTEVRAAARTGILWSVAELYPLASWRVTVAASDAFSASQVPVFLLDEERGAFAHAKQVSESQYLSLTLPDRADVAVDDPPHALVAGFDFSRAITTKEASSGARFDLSDCGAIELNLLDQNGAPFTEPRAVFLEEAGTEHAEDWDRSRWDPAWSPSVVAEKGRAFFAGVPPGKRWRVGAQLLPGSALVTMEIDGPTDAERLVRSTLSARDHSVLIRARIQDADGLPASRTSGELRGVGGCHVPFQTDADGLLLTRAPRAWIQANETIEIRDDYDPQHLGHRLEVPAAALLDDRAEATWTWREDLQSLLAQGRVVDTGGQAVAFAQLRSWEGAGGKADARGYFRLEAADTPSETDTLTASSPWHCEAEREVAPKSRGVELRLELGARLAGTIAKPHHTREPSVRYLRFGAEELVDLWEHGWWSGEGEFEVGPIPLDAIEVHFDFDKAGTAVLNDLRLEAGKVYLHPQVITPRK